MRLNELAIPNPTYGDGGGWLSWRVADGLLVVGLGEEPQEEKARLWMPWPLAVKLACGVLCRPLVGRRFRARQRAAEREAADGTAPE